MYVINLYNVCRVFCVGELYNNYFYFDEYGYVIGLRNFMLYDCCRILVYNEDVWVDLLNFVNVLVSLRSDFFGRYDI